MDSTTAIYPRLSELDSDIRLVQLAQILGIESEIHVVGGTVRDALLGAKPVDLDLASNVEAPKLIDLLSSKGLRVIPTGLKHNTVTVLFPDELGTAEVTTFRGIRDANALANDLALRDFTINALAYNPFSHRLVDHCGGHRDLQSRVVRAVGDAKARFQEDPLRIMRMVRFACLEGFSIDASCRAEALRMCHQVEGVSKERIRDEFSKILTSAHPDRGLRLLSECGLLGIVAPPLVACVGFEQNKFHKADVFEHTLEVVASTEPDLVLRLAALFHDIGKPGTLSVDELGERHFYLHEVLGAELTQECLARLRYSQQLIDKVVCLVRTHMRPIDCGAGGIRRLLRDTAELFPVWRKLKEADSFACKLEPTQLAQQLHDFDLHVAEVQKGPRVSPLSSLAINGNDLLAEGLSPGPVIGEILRGLHEQVLDNPELNEKETLLVRAREMLTDFAAPKRSDGN